MMKTLLLASAMTVSAPVLAQDMTTSNPQPATSPQTQSQPIDHSAHQATAQVSSADVPASQDGTDTAAQVAAETPAAGATQVAEVVEAEFPSYDKNSDAKLDKAEFGAWMVALKTASDPTTKATDPATVKWVSGAFASADTDTSNDVTKAELTKYLSQGAG